MHPYNKNEWHKNSAGVVDSDGSFPRHIWNSHREYFVAPTSVDLIVVALHNTAFHFAIKQLPLTAQAQLITSVQAVCPPVNGYASPVFELNSLLTTPNFGIQCLDHCSIDIDLAAARLQYLIDLCLSSGLLPTPCWIDKVIATKYQLITGGGDFSVYSGRHAGRAVAIRHRHGSLRGRGRPRLQLIQVRVWIYFLSPLLISPQVIRFRSRYSLAAATSKHRPFARHSTFRRNVNPCNDPAI